MLKQIEYSSILVGILGLILIYIVLVFVFGWLTRPIVKITGH